MEGNELSRLLAGGALGGVAITLVVAFWNKIKASWHYITGFLIQRVNVSQDAEMAVLCYLVTHAKLSSIRDREIRGFANRVKKGYGEVIAFEVLGEVTSVFWLNRFPLLVTSNKGKNERDGGIQLSFLRGAFDVDKLIVDAVKELNDIIESNLERTSVSRKRFFIRQVPDIKEPGKNESPSSGGNTLRSSSPAIEWFQQSRNRLLTHKIEDLGQALTYDGKALDNLFFPQSVEKLQHEIVLWRSKRQWYRSKGLPWKRGWLLHGAPGTGKTALARAFAEDLDMPIFVYNLAEITNNELRRKWMDMQSHAPCIALIEDIDGVFHGRTNVARRGFDSFLSPSMYDDVEPVKPQPEAAPFANPSSPPSLSASMNNPPPQPKGGLGAPLTFDCLLNVIDGVDRLEGIFTIITTNDITKVDEAIGRSAGLNQSTRPGRIDRVIELTYMTNTDKKRMANRILKDYPSLLEKVIKEVDSPDEPVNVTPSQFQERCAQRALEALWDETELQKHTK